MSDDVFVTKDIELAAFLHASDIKIVDVRKNEANKTVFVFSNADGRAKSMNLSFYNHEDQISASRLLWSFQQIKQLLFDPNLERAAKARA
jgi:hypothetical protein